MKLKFHVFVLRVMYRLIRSLDVSRAEFISRKDNIILWGLSERIESIANRVENQYVDYEWNNETRSYIHKNTIISGAEIFKPRKKK